MTWKTLEKAKGDPAHPRRIPFPDYRPPTPSATSYP